MRNTNTLTSSPLIDKDTKEVNSNQPSSKKRSPEAWRGLIVKWKESGLSQREFCERHKINLHTFTYHRHRKLKNEPQKNTLAAVHITSQQTHCASYDRFILQLQNGAKLSIPTHYDATSLKKLLTLLEVLPC